MCRFMYFNDRLMTYCILHDIYSKTGVRLNVEKSRYYSIAKKNSNMSCNNRIIRFNSEYIANILFTDCISRFICLVRVNQQIHSFYRVCDISMNPRYAFCILHVAAQVVKLVSYLKIKIASSSLTNRDKKRDKRLLYAGQSLQFQ